MRIGHSLSALSLALFLTGCVSSDAGTKAATATSDACANIELSNLCPPTTTPSLALEAASDCVGNVNASGAGDEVSVDLNLETNTACVSVGMCNVKCEPIADETCRLTTNSEGQLVCGECNPGTFQCPAGNDNRIVQECDANAFWGAVQDCSDDQTCVIGQGCISRDCGNGLIDDGEECDQDNGVPECAHLSLGCQRCAENCRLEEINPSDSEAETLPRYGDGIVQEPYESCDDGNEQPNDGCGAIGTIESGYECLTPGAACTLLCGNGTLDPDEECDGRTGVAECVHLSQDQGCRQCDNDCRLALITNQEGIDQGLPRHGDGIIQPEFEQCDDGNTEAGDGCGQTGILEPGYECSSAGVLCTSLCGNGFLDREEECDGDAGIDLCVYNDGQCTTCSEACTQIAVPREAREIDRMGDGRLTLGYEDCDDGDLISDDGCSEQGDVEDGWACTQIRNESSDCYRLNNGSLDPTEECDDGNMRTNDGCNPDGEVERGYRCTEEAGRRSECNTVCGDGIQTPDEACDDNNNVSGDGCDECRVSGCGNGIRVEPEQCDDGNLINGDDCDLNCTNTRCGNGIQTAGEHCDQGEANDDGGSCTTECTNAMCGDGLRRTNLPVGDTGYEYCDDGGMSDGSGGIVGDGCSPTCERWEIEPNNTMNDVTGNANRLEGNTLNVSMIRGQFDLVSGQQDNQDTYVLPLSCSTSGQTECVPSDQVTWDFQLEFNSGQPCLEDSGLGCDDYGIQVVAFCDGICGSDARIVPTPGVRNRQGTVKTFNWSYTGTRSGRWAFTVEHQGSIGTPQYTLTVANDAEE